MINRRSIMVPPRHAMDEEQTQHTPKENSNQERRKKKKNAYLCGDAEGDRDSDAGACDSCTKTADLAATQQTCESHSGNVLASAPITIGNDDNSSAQSQQHPVCQNCNLRHPPQQHGAGHFCTEGEQGFLESVVAMATLGLLCSWCHLVLVTMGLLAIHMLVWKSGYALGALAYLVSLIMWPVDNTCVPRDGFANSWLFTVWRRYFRWQCVVEEPLDPSKRYMFAEMPHGVMPMGQLLSCSMVRQAFPEAQKISGVAADAVLRMPGIRNLYSLLGIRRAGRESILDMFEDNINVAVVVGGIAEMFLASRKAETIYLKKRKNFTKLAVEAGANIVPVYFFGNTLLHDVIGGEGADNWCYQLSRKFKAAFVFFYGRWGTQIPRRAQLKMVSGRPISVIQSDDPSDAYVDSLHAELVKRVGELYYNHRPEWETRELIIT